MPYFKNNDDQTIVWRDHEYNSEYLNGYLELVGESDPCVILRHIPNKRWGYDVVTLKVTTTDVGFEETKKLGFKSDDNKPHVYYSLVAEDDLSDYFNNQNFTKSNFKVEKTEKENKPKISVQKNDPPIQGKTAERDVDSYVYKEEGERNEEEAGEEDKKPDIKLGGTKLVRDSETPVYTYKSAREKYKPF